MCDFILRTFWHPRDSSAAFPQKYLRTWLFTCLRLAYIGKRVNCCGLFWFVGGARFQSGGLYQMFFSTQTYSRFFWLFFLLNNLSTFLSHVLPHSSVSALSRSYTRCCMRCRCVVWGHIYVSHNKVTMTRPLREAAMFRWLIKICWMITWSSCVS